MNFYDIVYCGFDPTAASLHIGSLVPIMCMNWLQRCGHKTIAVIGGATAMIGDPSGKTESRKMLNLVDIQNNSESIETQINKIFSTVGDVYFNKFANNMDWYGEESWINLMRTIGPYFSVAHMLSMDSVKSRLSGGLTALEFNYMLMQAYDFFVLNNKCGCNVQIGGQDQWGNIIMGIDLIRKKSSKQVHGLTFPLLTQSNGKKFGKTEAGNIWLDPKLTSHFDFFQFWRNVADGDVKKLLRFLTFRSIQDIDTLVASDINYAKEMLAWDVTGMVHGYDIASEIVSDVRKAYNKSVDVTGEHIPSKTFPIAEFADGIKLNILLKEIGMFKSNSEASRLIDQGGIYLNGVRVDEPGYKVIEKDIVNGSIILQAGKKRLFRVDVK